MAGVKGRSGGPRANAGGARPGAGRPRKTPAITAKQVELEPQTQGGALKRERATPVEIGERDMLTLLQDIALGRVEATTGQIRAAIAAVQYTHHKAGEGGKKDAKKEAAANAARGRLAPKQPPKLVVSNG